jgi:hypothetical protein
VVTEALVQARLSVSVECRGLRERLDSLAVPTRTDADCATMRSCPHIFRLEAARSLAHPPGAATEDGPGDTYLCPAGYGK